MAPKKSSTGGAGAKKAPWRQSNKSCRYTYLILSEFLKQFEGVFSAVKTKKMKELRFWNPTASADLRAIAAGAVATEMSKIMTASDGYNSIYEPGYDYVKTHNSLVATLTNPDKTVPDVALVIDKAFKIPGE